MAADAPVPAAFVQALRELALIEPGEVPRGEALVGGVSSDIWRIDTRRGAVCAKRALARLRVAADWRAPIERNVYEARWMRAAAEAAPGAAPRLLGQHAALGVLVMDYLPPGRYALWKEQLRQGVARLATARAVGTTLAAIHAHSAARAATLAPQFDTDAIFYDIRLEPYLVATAARHGDVAPALHALVAQTQRNARALVHGDVSPKNILVPLHEHQFEQERSPDDAPLAEPPVLLDAECAWWGDPAFDLAFCLNHLLLKCLWQPAARDAFLACFAELAAAYLAGVDWEGRAALEQRAAALLPGLFLARVDGKSPVEYVQAEDDRALVRRVAKALLRQPPQMLDEVSRAWRQALDERGHGTVASAP